MIPIILYLEVDQCMMRNFKLTIMNFRNQFNIVNSNTNQKNMCNQSLNPIFENTCGENVVIPIIWI